MESDNDYKSIITKKPDFSDILDNNFALGDLALRDGWKFDIKKGVYFNEIQAQ